jgi:hypothetical protein
MLPMANAYRGGRLFRGVVAFIRDKWRYNRLMADSRSPVPFPIQAINYYPNFLDRYEPAGRVPRHYFLQDIWAAKKVFQSGVDNHYDIGSRLDGFIAHCLAFTKVTMLDIRPLPYSIQDLRFIECDCTNMAGIASESLMSLSTLHAMEHVGLGRYGDPVDPEGYVKAINEIQRVVARGGNLYFTLPIGRQRVEFNSHRVFDPMYIVALFDTLQLVGFSAINDRDEFVENARLDGFGDASYSCGLFHFRKP